MSEQTDGTPAPSSIPRLSILGMPTVMELERLRAENERLRSQRVRAFCQWCGWTGEGATREQAALQISSHISDCERHPTNVLKRFILVLAERLAVCSELLSRKAEKKPEGPP